MKTKYILTLITFVLITNIFSQSKIDDYQYVVVPKQYDFFNEADKYQLNSMTKFLLEKENFNVLFEDEMPEALLKNRCLSLFANVTENGNMFKTKLTVELVDCNNRVIFKAKEGVSNEKDYKKGYHDALRDAFKSFKILNYNYQPKQVKQEIVEVIPVDELKVEKPVVKLTSEPSEVFNKKVTKPEIRKTVKTSKLLYAQEIDGGFQIVDNIPQVIMKLIRTPKEGVFIVKGQDAIVYKQDGFWYLAKNEKSPETLNIKF